VLDLLPDRTAETLSAWLQQHPQIQIVARDRSGEYARGILMGATQAQQLADRWHLLLNLRDAFTRMLNRFCPELLTIPASPGPEKSGEISFQKRRDSQNEGTLRDHCRARRLELHEKVHRLRRPGHSIQAIARYLKRSRPNRLSLSFHEPLSGLHAGAVSAFLIPSLPPLSLARSVSKRLL